MTIYLTWKTKKYYTIKIILKSNCKIIETEIKSIYPEHSYTWLRYRPIKSGRVKLALWCQTSMRFPHLKMPTLTYTWVRTKAVFKDRILYLNYRICSLSVSHLLHINRRQIKGGVGACIFVMLPLLVTSLILLLYFLYFTQWYKALWQ